MHSEFVVLVEDVVILVNSKWESDAMVSTLPGLAAGSDLEFWFFFTGGHRSLSFKMDARPSETLKVLVALFPW
jgi:hypothetical protein